MSDIKSLGDVNVNSVCKLEMKKNPKRVGSKAWERYEMYEDAKSVGEYLEKGGNVADLRYDYAKGFLELSEKWVKGAIIKI